MTRGRTSPLAVATISMACGVWACSRAPTGGAAPAPVAVEVTLAPVVRGSAERTIDVTGTLFGQDETVIAAPLGGEIATVEADLGDTVPAGGVLARIDDTFYRLAVEEKRAAVAASLARLGLATLPPAEFDPVEVPTVRRARAQAANAQARFRRAEDLYRQQPPVISLEEFDDLRTAWEVAERDADVALLTARAVLADARTQRAAAAVAEHDLEETVIRAPESAGGVPARYEVARRLVSIGEHVGEGDALFRLVATDEIKFRADVPERFAGRVRAGQTARVEVEGLGTAALGRVARVAPTVEAASRTLAVEVQLANPDGRLRPGAFARGYITTEVEEGVAFVPVEAVVTFAGVRRVFSVADARAVEHRVELGVRREGLVEIVGGLGVEAVVIGGAGALTDGAAVVVRGP